MLGVRFATTIISSIITVILIGSNFPGNVFLETKNVPLFLLAISSACISAFILFEIKNTLMFSITTIILAVSLYFLLIGCVSMFTHRENPIEYLILVPFAIILFWKEFMATTLVMSSLEYLLGKVYNERSSKSP